VNKKILISVLIVVIGILLLAGGWYLIKRYFLSEKVSPEQKASLEQTVEAFYNLYLSQASRENVEGLTLDKRLAQEDFEDYVAPESISQIKSIVESEEEIGSDPIICAQVPPESFSVSLKDKRGTEAEVVVAEQYGGEKTYDIIVNLKLVDNKWKIVKIICPNL